MKTTTTTKTISYSSIEERDSKAEKLIKIHERRSWLKRQFLFSDYDRKLEIEYQLKLLNKELARTI